MAEALDLPTVERWYDAEDAADGVTRLWEPHVDPFLESNVWHVRGSKGDLVVDAGNGVGPLAPAIDVLGDGRPVTAVATHAHFDHVGALGEFDDRRCHELDAGMPAPGPLALLRRDFPAWLVADFAFYGSPLPEVVALRAVPGDGFDVGTWRTPGVAPTATLADGDRIDLGDRELEVLHAPGHTPGSICLWEAASGLVFTGDAFYVDAPLGWEDREAFEASLRRLRELPVRLAHTGHGRSVDGQELRSSIDVLLAASGPSGAASGPSGAASGPSGAASAP